MTLRRRWLAALLFALPVHGQYVTLTGTLSASNGLPAANYVMNFMPSQFGYVAGTGVVVNTATSCATGSNGGVVGIPNPLTAPTASAGGGGTLPAGNYYTKIAFYDAAGNSTQASPEQVTQLTATGILTVTAPALPLGAVGMRVYVASTSGAETLQGSAAGGAAYTQAGALVTGTAAPASNSTVCQQIANDAMWPSGTGYQVSLTDPSGNTLPGYPMLWQLMGPNSTINLSSGLPYYHGTVYFPSPILATPLNNALQSIAGPLSLSGYNLTNVGAVGFGTNAPAWPVDVENGAINASGGFLYNGAAPLNHILLGNGTTYVDSASFPATTITGLGYQSISANGVPLTLRPTLNFSSRFAVTDSASPAQTSIDLAPVGTAGTFANPASVTLDGFGRVTAVTPGTGGTGTRVCNSNGCYVLEPDGTLYQWGVATVSGSGAVSVTVTFPHAFTSTTNLSVQATCGNVGNRTNCVASVQSSTTTTASIGLAGVTFVGGAGSDLPGTETANWFAVGN